MGVGLVAIGNGAAFMARAFQEDHHFKGELFTDPTKRVYDALNCKRGMRLVLGRKALAQYKKAIGEGYGAGKTQGDGAQLGGVFILSREGVVWQHLEEYGGDHPENEVVLKALEKLVTEKK